MNQAKRAAIFIRHGQSAANVGQWDGAFSEVPLTAVGEEQARALAATWNFVPGRIIVSPFLRTRQTAAPTIERFPHIPVEYWEIHEFTYWDRAFWGDTVPEEALEDVAKFWRVADPDSRAGTAGVVSESFGELLGRTEAVLEKLLTLEETAPVLLFTHGHFMQALRHTLLWPEWTATKKMANFRAYDETYRVLNTEQIRVDRNEQEKWRLV